MPAENYPFCTIDPSVGVVAVPDERLAKLSVFSKSAKTIPAAVEFVDIAGLVKGAAEGQGLGNKFLSHIRETDAIAEVVRIFKDDKIIHVENKIDPLNDIGVINLELVLADLETVTKRLASIQKDVKSHKKGAILEDNLLQRVRKILEEGRLANGILLHDDEKPILKQLNLLSVKPILYVLNSSEAGENDETILSKIPGAFVRVDPVFENGLNDLIKKSYEILDLITYFTTGEDETRAWTIKRGSTAPEAGAAIHTDFREKFIKAEVIEWEKLLAGGLTRTEGKNYLVQDGDVIEFKI
ncbi:MAG: GTP-dependent nucleic acid-binding protein EngD [Candidatus Beckwithbacteria bacterium GW2011_GWA2_43_10]|uniref:GTP-dependent nucleic acid-binding protein EngD n=1 Tax=Candidatus Beckwithbacteria bacterium GW2011_GWA2_43_10 TaxID=1618369 RepID=A0A0G1C200_9BACT|nr:MAG: GTP-dependent nucleic acid-binding protein EngD [Candidatus Beckwithbacteria bacterium GW2011_GWA2_43_10]